MEKWLDKKRLDSGAWLLVLQILILATLLVSPPQNAAAATKALLIGVSNYDNSIGLADLRGPLNDVMLLKSVLTKRGVSDITVLADGAAGAQLPTLANIVSGFKTLANQAKDGDLIIIHMSGHGSRQSDDSGDEADGFDEVFLPLDVRRAENGERHIPNALVDDDIGKLVHAIRSKGADVFIIMDFCNSGTSLRAASLNMTSRFVTPSALGMQQRNVAPIATSERQEFLPDNPARAQEPKGGLAAFYAAQASGVARELNFETGSNNQASGWYGLFTAKLAARLATAGTVTYRQLFQSVLADMNDTSVPGAARLQTPFWAGSMMEATVLGGSKTVGIRQFPLNGDTLSAGQVQGLTLGTIVELFPDAASPNDAGIGYAQIEEAKAVSSYIRYVLDTCIPNAKALCHVAKAPRIEARFARVVATPLKFQLKLSPIKNADGTSLNNSTLATHLRQAIADLSQERKANIMISDSDYDVEIVLRENKLWFGLRASEHDAPLGVSWEGKDGGLKNLLWRIVQAERLATTMRNIAGSNSMLNPSPVNISTVLQRSDENLLTPPGRPLNPRRECARMAHGATYGAHETLETSTALKQCDRVEMHAQGKVAGSRDINRIHIDAKFCIHNQYTRVEDARTSVAIGSPMIICSDCPGGKTSKTTQYSTGYERLFFLVSDATKNADQLNLTGLVENCGRPKNIRRSGRSLATYLKILRKRRGTRGAFGGTAPGKVWVKELGWKVVPRKTIFMQMKTAGKSP